MHLLILGMVIFLAVHLVPTFVDLRQKLIGWKGEAFYKIGYSCAALVGLILIIIGKRRAAHVPVWDPPDWAYQATQITPAPLSFRCFSHPIKNVKRVQLPKPPLFII